jgi:glycosyltransferase involved in cell wall biosynthesis
MRFSQTSMNEIVARAISVLVSIFLGLAGYGYWALVAGAVALPLSTSIGACYLCRWTPGLPRHTEGTSSSLSFAIHTYGSFLVNYFSRNTDNLLVGWRFDARALGFYKKAYDLFALSAMQLVISITLVMVSALSRIRQNADQYRSYLLEAMTAMAFLGMGLGADLTLIGKDLIRALLGAQWAPAGRIFTFFGPGIGAMILYTTTSWIHLSSGRADRWLRWGIFEFVVTCSLFIVGLHWGPAGIAVAWTASFWLLIVPAIWYAGRPVNLNIKAVLAAVWRYPVAALVAGITTAILIPHISFLYAVSGFLGALFRILLISTLVTISYLVLIVILYGSTAPLYQMTRLLLEVWPGKRAHSTDESSAGTMTGQPSVQTSSGRMPLVSILIPAYNAQDWIADTIKSALAQTWPNTEIIVIDDESSDQTLAIARQFEPLGVRVIQQSHQGAAAARNLAFSLSSGDYIQWLDADDLLAPDKIAQQMEAVQQGVGKRILLSAACASFMYRPYRAQFTPTELWCDLSPVEWLLRKMGQNLSMQTATWLVSRELTETAGPWDPRLSGDDDGEYFCRVILACEEVRFVRNARVYYRSLPFSGLSHIDRIPRKVDAHWLSMRLHMQYLRSLEDSPRVQAACIQFIQDSLAYFYPERRDILGEAEAIADGFGRQLSNPKLSWKYAWIKALFGWKLTKPTQLHLRRVRWSFHKRLDYLLFQIENGK